MKKLILIILVLLVATLGYADPIRSLIFEDADHTGTITVIPPDSNASNVTLTLPNETGTILTSTSSISNTVNGDNITNDTIDDDSIDFGDVTCVDMTMTDCGAITTGSIVTLNGTLTVTGTADSGTGILLVPHFTSDPCNAAREGGIFWNDTSNELCYCDGTNDLRADDGTTACF